MALVAACGFRRYLGTGKSLSFVRAHTRQPDEIGILDKRSYAEIPPRVEYRLTPFGDRFGGILDQIEAMEKELD